MTPIRPPIRISIPQKNTADGKTRGQFRELPQIENALVAQTIQQQIARTKQIEELGKQIAELKEAAKVWRVSALYDMKTQRKKLVDYEQYKIAISHRKPQAKMTLEALSDGMTEYFQKTFQMNENDAWVAAVTALKGAIDKQDVKTIEEVSITIPKERKARVITLEKSIDILRKKKRLRQEAEGKRSGTPSKDENEDMNQGDDDDADGDDARLED